jgi:hypothetical protein
VAVSDKLAIGQNCPIDGSLPSLWVNGQAHILDDAQVDGELKVDRLSFVSSKGETMTTFTARTEQVSKQTGVHGSLRVDGRFAVGTSASDDTSQVGRLVVRASDGPVPSQVWQSNAGAGVSAVDAQGRLGVGTVQPAALLTVRGMFLQQLDGTLTGRANIATLDGTGTNVQRDLAVGDQLYIPSASPTQYKVTRVDPKAQKIDVDPAPTDRFSRASLYVDGALLRVSGGADNSLLQIDGRGALNGITSSWSGSLTVNGLSTLTGGAQITGDTSVSDGTLTTNGSAVLKKGAQITGDTSVSDGTLTTNGSAVLKKGAQITGDTSVSDGTLTTNGSAVLKKGAQITGDTSVSDGTLTTNGSAVLKKGAQITGDTTVSAGNLTIDTPYAKAGNLIFKQMMTLYGGNRMHIMGEEFLWVLNKSGMIVGKDWGGTGNLTVNGLSTLAGGAQITGNASVSGGTLSAKSGAEITGDTTISSGTLTTNGSAVLKKGAQITGDTTVSAGNFTIDTPYAKAGNLIFKQMSTIYGGNRMHIMGEELLWVLNKSGMIVGKDWGGNGNLTVAGTLYANGGIAEEQWQTPTLPAGWGILDANWSGAEFCKDALGYVHVRGLIACAKESFKASVAVFTLPVGYRPAKYLLFPSLMGEPWTPTRCDVYPNGQVWAMFAPGANPTSAKVWLTLSAIHFKAQQ